MDSGYCKSIEMDYFDEERRSPQISYSKSFSSNVYDSRFRGSKFHGRRRTVHSRDFSANMADEEDFGADSIQSHGLALKDQEHTVKDLKKENFDLKLRLYMEQKKNESSDSRIEEYERQISELLDRYEEAAKEADSLQVDLKETRLREKMLITKKKRLERQCVDQKEKIHHLSSDLSRIQSMSMQDISGFQQHSTPLRNARSEYHLEPHHEDESTVAIGDYDDDDDDDDDDFQRKFVGNDDGKPFSPVQPMIREQSTDSNAEFDSAFDEDTPQGNQVIARVQNITIHQRNNSTRSYNNQYTPVKNFYNYEMPDGHPVAATLPRTNAEADNIGIVRPNNSRIGIDANINTYVVANEEEQTKKKKKGFMKIFKMCSGGNSSKVKRNASVYHKTGSAPRPRPIPEERPGDFQL